MSAASKKKTHHKHHKKNKNKSKEDPEETKEPAPAPATEETEKPVTEETEKPVKASDTVPEEKKKPTKSFLRDDTDKKPIEKVEKIEKAAVRTDEKGAVDNSLPYGPYKKLNQVSSKSKEDPEETKEPAPATEETEKPVTEKPVKASGNVSETDVSEKKKPTKSFLRDDTDKTPIKKVDHTEKAVRTDEKGAIDNSLPYGPYKKLNQVSSKQ